MREEGYGCLYSLFVIVMVIVITLFIAGFIAGWSYIELPDQTEAFPL